ncbi:hypothetical protein HPG69_004278 [Diceros bicornis minor]|uniref:Glyceraldehyde-3-phosphate dehydrogenase n=1 Tax=Diceros bicornis minor TaxID=77932 RepID=A0A7J7EB24_DICBM|nr:hypothetical protein HPG69_004278 [Diceros bicornis minor]
MTDNASVQKFLRCICIIKEVVFQKLFPLEGADDFNRIRIILLPFPVLIPMSYNSHVIMQDPLGQAAASSYTVQATSLRHMVKVRVNGFGCLGHLVTRAVFNSGKVDIVAICGSFIDLNYMYVSTHGKFNGTVKVENWKLVINGKPIFIFQE